MRKYLSSYFLLNLFINFNFYNYEKAQKENICF